MPPRLLLVTIDRLPAWILPAWGSTWVSAPALNALAGRGLVFDRLISPSLDPRQTLDALAGALVTAAARAGLRVGVVTDEASGAALAYGRELARTFGATLHVLHVADDVYVRLGGDAYMAVLPELQRDLEVAAQKQLDELLIDNDPVPLPVKSAVLTSSATAAAIVQYARDLDIALIVVGTHGRGALAHLLMGSVAERVVRSASCPVLTVRHPEHDFVMPDALATIAQA